MINMDINFLCIFMFYHVVLNKPILIRRHRGNNTDYNLIIPAVKDYALLVPFEKIEVIILPQLETRTR